MKRIVLSMVVISAFALSIVFGGQNVTGTAAVETDETLVSASPASEHDLLAAGDNCNNVVITECKSKSS